MLRCPQRAIRGDSHTHVEFALTLHWPQRHISFRAFVHVRFLVEVHNCLEGLELDAQLHIFVVELQKVLLNVESHLIIASLQNLREFAVEVVSDLSAITVFQLISGDYKELQKLSSNLAFMSFIVGQQIFHFLQQFPEHHGFGHQLPIEHLLAFPDSFEILFLDESCFIGGGPNKGLYEIAEQCQHHPDAVLLNSDLALEWGHGFELLGEAEIEPGGDPGRHADVLPLIEHPDQVAIQVDDDPFALAILPDDVGFVGGVDAHDIRHERVHRLKQGGWEVGHVQELPAEWPDQAEEELAEEDALVWVAAQQNYLPLEEDRGDQADYVGGRQVEAQRLLLAVAAVQGVLQGVEAQTLDAVHPTKDDLLLCVAALAVEMDGRNVEVPDELGGEVEFVAVVPDLGEGEPGEVVPLDDAFVHFELVLRDGVADSAGRALAHGMINADEAFVELKLGVGRDDGDGLGDEVVLVAAEAPIPMIDDSGLFLSDPSCTQQRCELQQECHPELLVSTKCVGCEFRLGEATDCTRSSCWMNECRCVSVSSKICTSSGNSQQHRSRSRSPSYGEATNCCRMQGRLAPLSRLQQCWGRWQPSTAICCMLALQSKQVIKACAISRARGAHC